MAAVLFAFCVDSWAHSPKVRELCGSITEINAKSHALITRSPKHNTPTTLVWTCDTKFIQSHRFSESTALETGLRVCLYYRSPFFSKPFVTKVVLANDERIVIH